SPSPLETSARLAAASSVLRLGSSESCPSREIAARARAAGAQAQAIGCGPGVIDARLQIASGLRGGELERAHGGFRLRGRMHQFRRGGADAVLAGAQRVQLAVEAPEIEEARAQHDREHAFEHECDWAHGSPPSFISACWVAGVMPASMRTASE